MAVKGTDFYTASGANVLVTMIEAYWLVRGFDGVKAERFAMPGGLYGVRSNIGPNGYPPRA